MKNKSKLDKIYEEIAYDTGIKKSVVQNVIKSLFVKIGASLIQNTPVMIRKYIKIVKASRQTKSTQKNYNDYETRSN
jgi:nucleoid DNA-binding protein